MQGSCCTPKIKTRSSHKHMVTTTSLVRYDNRRITLTTAGCNTGNKEYNTGSMTDCVVYA
jgi:hypothetical protein